MNKGPATLQQCAKRPDLAGWYTGENSGGVPPWPLFVEFAAGTFTKTRGPRAERVPSSACVLLVHPPHGFRQLAPPGAWSEGCWGFWSRALFWPSPGDGASIFLCACRPLAFAVR